MPTSTFRDLLKDNEHRIMIIHYSCSSIREIPCRISCIGIRDEYRNQTRLFSLRKFSEEEILENFWGIVAENKERYFVGWNIKNPEYGFSVLKERYEEISGKEAPKIKMSHIVDLDEAIKRDYDLKRQKMSLKGLAEINRYQTLNFRNGKEELQMFEEEDFKGLELSVGRKLKIMGDILNDFMREELQTKGKLRMKDLSDFLGKIRNIQSIMVLVSTGRTERKEREVEYQELRKELKRYFAAFAIYDPNPFSSLEDFYGYYRAKLPTYQERRDFIRKMYEDIERTIESAPAKEGKIEISDKSPQMTTMPKILFLAANPKNTVRLRLDQEVREIEQRVLLAQMKDRLIMVNKGAVRVGDLQFHLNQERPTIVHFSGHGTEESRIILEDNLGNARTVPTEALARVFKVLKDNIRCVVLNACFSSEQAFAISRHIDCVIGMSSSISDEAAVAFSAGFYLAIASGRSVQNAFDQGINELMLWEIPEEHVPQLLVRDDVDPSEIFLLKRGSPRATEERLQKVRPSIAEGPGIIYNLYHSQSDVKIDGSAEITRIVDLEVMSGEVSSLDFYHFSKFTEGCEITVSKISGESNVSVNILSKAPENVRFAVDFSPSLKERESAAFQTKEKYIEGYPMTLGQIADLIREGTWTGEPYVYKSCLVKFPTKQLVLTAVLPENYDITTSEEYFDVRVGYYGGSRHLKEYARLRKSDCCSIEKVSGRKVLKLTVKNPMMGLVYMVKWKPPTEKNYEKLCKD